MRNIGVSFAVASTILINYYNFLGFPQRSKLKILMDDVTKNGSSVTLLRIARVIRSLSITLLKRCETARSQINVAFKLPCYIDLP